MKLEMAIFGGGPTNLEGIKYFDLFFCHDHLLTKPCYMKQRDSMLSCICPVIDHRRRQNVVRASVTHSAIASCATFLFLQHFHVICILLLDRYMATWNLFVK